MRHIGVMGGSYNPVHTGHMIIADYICQKYDLDEIWMIMSPLNPLKRANHDIASDNDRLEMLKIACNHSERIKPSDIELSMPRPSYTVDTLAKLRSLYPDTRFSLIIGSDNWLVFDKWKDYRKILTNHMVIIFPRAGYPISELLPEGVTMCDAPVMEISSTFIRERIAEGFDMNFFLPEGVFKYIEDHSLYNRPTNNRPTTAS